MLTEGVMCKISHRLPLIACVFVSAAPSVRAAQSPLCQLFLAKTAPLLSLCDIAPAGEFPVTSDGGAFKCLFYKQCALSSSPDFALRYAGAMSSTVIAPLLPSLKSLNAARAYAIRTEPVNSGLESSLRLYSITCF